MNNAQLIKALYETGLVGKITAFTEVVNILRIKEQSYKAWPYILQHKNDKLLAVKAIKDAFEIGLKEAKDMADLLWDIPESYQPFYIKYHGEILPYIPNLQIVLDKTEQEYELLDSNEIPI